MLACHGKYRIAQQPIDCLDRTAGDDGHSVVQHPSQRAQYIRQLSRHHHSVRRGRDINQRAVQIEQQRGLPQRRQGHH